MPQEGITVMKIGYDPKEGQQEEDPKQAPEQVAEGTKENEEVKGEGDLVD